MSSHCTVYVVHTICIHTHMAAWKTKAHLYIGPPTPGVISSIRLRDTLHKKPKKPKYHSTIIYISKPCFLTVLGKLQGKEISATINISTHAKNFHIRKLLNSMGNSSVWGPSQVSNSCPNNKGHNIGKFPTMGFFHLMVLHKKHIPLDDTNQ